MSEMIVCPRCEAGGAYRHDDGGSVPRVACMVCGLMFEDAWVADWQAADRLVHWFHNFCGNAPVFWGPGDRPAEHHIHVWCLGLGVVGARGYRVSEYSAHRTRLHSFFIHVLAEDRESRVYFAAFHRLRGDVDMALRLGAVGVN